MLASPPNALARALPLARRIVDCWQLARSTVRRSLACSLLAHLLVRHSLACTLLAHLHQCSAARPMPACLYIVGSLLAHLLDARLQIRSVAFCRSGARAHACYAQYVTCTQTQTHKKVRSLMPVSIVYYIIQTVFSLWGFWRCLRDWVECVRAPRVVRFPRDFSAIHRTNYPSKTQAKQGVEPGILLPKRHLPCPDRPRCPQMLPRGLPDISKSLHPTK